VRQDTRNGKEWTYTHTEEVSDGRTKEKAMMIATDDYDDTYRLN